MRKETEPPPPRRSENAPPKAPVFDELADLERRESGTVGWFRARLLGMPVTPEERRAIVDELFFEGAAHGPYLRQFFVLLSVSVTIAAFGLVRNATAVVIGAMLLAPLMTPIMALAAAIVMGWSARQVRTLGFLALASAYVIGLTYVLLAIFQVPHNMPPPDELIARTDYGVGDLLAALCAGIAGAYMQVRREAAMVLPGVAIAVALVPPLTAAGIFLYLGDIDLASRAAILYLTNIAAIVLSACIIFLLSGVKPRVRDRGLHTRVTAGFALAVTVAILLGIELLGQTARTIGAMRDTGRVLDVVREWSGSTDIEVENIKVTGDEVYIDLTVEVPIDVKKGVTLESIIDSLPPDMRIRRLDAQLDQRLERDVETTLRSRVRLLSTTCTTEDRCHY
jgi:uncharacterized hydrophobic protein (TIGR00271 family)